MDLEDVVESIRCKDISDPSCMDEILIYYKQIKAEDEAFMQLLEVKCMEQEITWEQPWYQQGESLTRPLKEQCENEIDTYRKDTISKRENEIIQNNWNTFRKQYDIPDKLGSFARWKNEDRKTIKYSSVEHARRFLIAYLARNLERTLFQVYRHVLTFYGCPKKGPYESHELKLMKVCCKHYPTRAVVCLSIILGREPRGLYKYMTTICDGKLQKKRFKWTLPLATTFLQLLLKHTGRHLEELKNLKIGKDVWLKMQEDMDHHHVYLHDFWYTYLHVQLFVKSDVKLSRVKKRILQRLQDSDYEVWSDIRWKDLVKHFPDGFTYRFLYKLCHRMCYKYPKFHTAPLQEIVNHHLKKLKLSHFKNRRLKTLRFNKDEKLEYVIYNKCEE